jgi:polysaccharide chain length determinant protein (PEP-CTERM system associated)
MMMTNPLYLLLHLVSAAWRRRFLILVPMLCLPPLALLASSLTPKVYESRMTILVQEPAKLNPFLNDLSIGPDLKNRMEGLKALLHSEHILENVLRDIGVIDENTDPKHKQSAINVLSSSINVQLIGNDLIELRLRDGQAEGLAKALNVVSNRFIERILSPERSAVSNSEDFLQQQISERKKELEAAEEAFANFKAENADKLPDIYVATMGRLTSLEQQIDAKRTELASAAASLGSLQSQLTSTNPIIGALEDDIVKLTRELSSLRAKYTESHSSVIAVRRNLSRLEAERKALLDEVRELTPQDVERLWNRAANASSSTDASDMPLLVTQMLRLKETQTRRIALETEIEQMEKAVANLRLKITEFAPVEKQLVQLQSKIVLAREMYDSLSKRHEMARVTGALGRFESPERIKVIDEAMDPVRPITPGKSVFLIISIITSLLVGAGLAFVAELLDPTIRSLQSVISLSGLEVITRVPPVSQAALPEARNDVFSPV